MKTITKKKKQPKSDCGKLRLALISAMFNYNV